jgi:hypothetical protein
MLDGSVSEPLLVTLSVFVPVDAGVYVNVPVGEPLEMLTVVGVKVPPPPPSAGVTITVPVITPFAPTVKFVDATPLTPVVGPVNVIAVAAEVETYEILDGSDNDPLFVTLSVLVPVEAGVYVNVPVGDPLEILTVVGVNVPPLPASDGVTTTVPVIVPFAPTVKSVDATPVTPVVGPDSVTAVAAGVAESLALLSKCHKARNPDSVPA